MAAYLSALPLVVYIKKKRGSNRSNEQGAPVIGASQRKAIAAYPQHRFTSEFWEPKDMNASGDRSPLFGQVATDTASRYFFRMGLFNIIVAVP